MKKLFLFSLLLVLGALFLDSCKKGPQDPLISFKSRQSRLVGKWKMTSMMVNDTERIDRVHHSVSNAGACGNQTTTIDSATQLQLTFDKNGDYTQVYTLTVTTSQSYSVATCPGTSVPVISGYTTKGKWIFSGGTEGIKWKQGLSILHESPEQTNNFNILELSSKTLILEQWIIDPLFGGLVKIDYTLVPDK